MAVFGLKPCATQKKRRLRLCRGEGDGAEWDSAEGNSANGDSAKGGQRKGRGRYMKRQSAKRPPESKTRLHVMHAGASFQLSNAGPFVVHAGDISPELLTQVSTLRYGEIVDGSIWLF